MTNRYFAKSITQLLTKPHRVWFQIMWSCQGAEQQMFEASDKQMRYSRLASAAGCVAPSLSLRETIMRCRHPGRPSHLTAVNTSQRQEEKKVLSLLLWSAFCNEPLWKTKYDISSIHAGEEIKFGTKLFFF